MTSIMCESEKQKPRHNRKWEGSKLRLKEPSEHDVNPTQVKQRGKESRKHPGLLCNSKECLARSLESPQTKVPYHRSSISLLYPVIAGSSLTLNQALEDFISQISEVCKNSSKPTDG